MFSEGRSAQNRADTVLGSFVFLEYTLHTAVFLPFFFLF